MNKISVQVIINSLRSRVDGSLGLSMTTPELSTAEKVELMGLQNEVLQAVFIPIETPEAPEYKINKDLEVKTPSQRLRNTLYIWYEQTKPDTTFEVFYKEKMESLIQFVKNKLEN